MHGRAGRHPRGTTLTDDGEETALEWIGNAAAYWLRAWRSDWRELGHDAGYPQRVKDIFTNEYLDACYQEMLEKYLGPVDTPLPGM